MASGGGGGGVWGLGSRVQGFRVYGLGLWFMVFGLRVYRAETLNPQHSIGFDMISGMVGPRECFRVASQRLSPLRAVVASFCSLYTLPTRKGLRHIYIYICMYIHTCPICFKMFF